MGALAGGQVTLGFQRPSLVPFSTPDDPNGYNDTSISGDIISDLYNEFVATCREAESEMLVKTLLGTCFARSDSLARCRHSLASYYHID